MYHLGATYPFLRSHPPTCPPHPKHTQTRTLPLPLPLFSGSLQLIKHCYSNKDCHTIHILSKRANEMQNSIRQHLAAKRRRDGKRMEYHFHLGKEEKKCSETTTKRKSK